MSKKYIKKDIYDRRGVLLIAEGQELSEFMIGKLEEQGYAQARETLTKKDDYKQNVKDRIKHLKNNLKAKNTRLVDSSSEIITNILFESKKQPWWIYINTLSNYVDWLYTHSIDVAVLSVMIAEELHIDRNAIHKIALGALLHDIGKLMIPKNIIEKPGKLTEEETFYMRQHCDLGISMVKDFCLPKMSLDIIQQHHERLDGSGYPNGLIDSQIPIHSRIAMTADVLDAITSFRPYRPERQIGSAINELKADPAKYPQETLQICSKLFTAS